MDARWRGGLDSGCYGGSRMLDIVGQLYFYRADAIVHPEYLVLQRGDLLEHGCGVYFRNYGGVCGDGCPL